jgi:hypothetical protein
VNLATWGIFGALAIGWMFYESSKLARQDSARLERERLEWTTSEEIPDRH